ncbi:MAG TPA: ParA family protein [Acidobacteriota bacterium]
MRTIAVCNLKGGVGKTTTTVNLGACLARNGKRVLLVDCDPQGSLSNWLRAIPTNGESTLYEILRGQATVRAAAVPTRWPNLSVVPSSPKLHEIDRGALAGERVLWARMCEDFDYALFDCSAAAGVVLTNALTAAEEVIVPVQARGMAMGGVQRLQRLLQDMTARGNREVQLTGILVCQFDARTTISRQVLGQLRAEYAGLVFDTVVHESVRLSEAADCQRPITDYDPGSRGAAEYAAIAFELMTRERRPLQAAAAGRASGCDLAAQSARPFAARSGAVPDPATRFGLNRGVAAGPEVRAAAPAPARAHHAPPLRNPFGRD